MATQPYLPDYVDERETTSPRLALPFTLVARSMGWIGLSFWLGVQFTAQFVAPAVTFTALGIGTSNNLGDTHVRTAYWITGLVNDRANWISLYAALAVIIATLYEALRSRAPRWQAYLPLAATVGAGFCLLKCAQLRFGMWMGGRAFADAYSRYPGWVTAEIVIVMMVAVLSV